ncbi:MAG: hypothetical protein HY898_14580 [Deltaproteobacteria bacterium]|nr:hypothetical protein [Deltaproteobacteria bacterium]
MNKQDQLMDELAALGSCELEAAADQRIQRRARAMFVRCARKPEAEWMHGLARAWRAAVEPAFVVAGSAGFLGWALSTVIALYS